MTTSMSNFVMHRSPLRNRYSVALAQGLCAVSPAFALAQATRLDNVLNGKTLQHECFIVELNSRRHLSRCMIDNSVLRHDEGGVPIPYVEHELPTAKQMR